MNSLLSIPDDKRAGSYHPPRLKLWITGGAVLLVAFAATFAPAVWKIGSGAQKDLRLADTAVARFHQQLNAGSFEQIYDDSDTEFKGVTTQEKFVNILSAIHRKLGPVQSTEREAFVLNYGTAGERIRLTYSTQFEGDKAQEQFVFQVVGDDLRLVGYDIRSDALITK